MSIISANTLFHFTHEQDTLLKILEFGFRPKYSREFGKSTNNRPSESHIPMVCFCDLPLSSIERHSKGYECTLNGISHPIKGYGEFGLGLSKEWGVRQNLNPVTYVTLKSHLLNYAIDTVSRSGAIVDEYFSGVNNDIRNVPKRIIDSIHNIYGSALNVISYIKPYEDFETGQRYYNEREWRFVIPFDISKLNTFYPVLTHVYPDAEATIAGLQSIINGDSMHRLVFNPSDIKYIIVKHDKDVQVVLKHLISLPEKYSSEAIQRLASHILTSEQIHEDF